MSRVTIEYFGMTGEGRTVKEAKEDAGRKIKTWVEGYRPPQVIEYRGAAAIVYSTPTGPEYALLTDERGNIRTEGLCLHSTRGDWAEVVRSARFHLGQMVWTFADGANVPEVVKDDRDRRELLGWILFQINYKRLRDLGLSDTEAHTKAVRYPCDDAELAKLAAA